MTGITCSPDSSCYYGLAVSAGLGGLPWPRRPALWLPFVFSSLKYKKTQSKWEPPKSSGKTADSDTSPSPPDAVTMEISDPHLSVDVTSLTSNWMTLE